MDQAIAHGTVVTAPRQVSRLKISFANKHDFTNRVYILTAFIFSRDSPRGLIIARAKHPASFLGRKFLRGISKAAKFVEEILSSTSLSRKFLGQQKPSTIILFVVLFEPKY
jgi:hypothetical protein